MTRKSLFAQIDFGLIALVTLLSALGYLVLWSSTTAGGETISPYTGRQLKWFMIGFFAMATVMMVDYRWLHTYAWEIYCGVLLMLLLVLVTGTTSMGAQRWLVLGPLRVQPSELTKIGIAIIMARLLDKESDPPPYGFRSLVGPLLVLGTPMALVLLQPDLGTSILIGGVGVGIMLFQGVRRKVAFTAIAAVAAAMPLGWSALKDYQKQRILTFLDPERDPLGAGYHIIQSKIAVGSGQIFGKGLAKGTQAQLKFLPERHTDFIFSVLAEEWGFVGCVTVLSLYALLILWGLDIAAKAKDNFGRLLAVGLTSIILYHVLVNVGMVTGLLPVVGVPLPLFSYGGSSVLTTFLIVGLLSNIRMRRFTR